MEITIWGVLVGAILPLAGYLIVHYLALSRDSASRKSQACNDFRKKVVEAESKIPNFNLHWNDLEISKLSESFKDIETAAEIFKYFLKGKEREQFDSALQLLRNLVNTHVPNALSKANIMYPGDQRTPKQAKDELKEKIDILKFYAGET